MYVLIHVCLNSCKEGGFLLWRNNSFFHIPGVNLHFGSMAISTMEEVILAKHLGIAFFLRKKISLFKTLKFGALNKI